MSDSTIVFLILGGVVVLFVSQRVPVALVAVLAALALYLTDVLTVEQALAGFGDPTVIFIAALFVVSEALDSTGVTAWAGQQLIEKSKGSNLRLMVLMMILVAVMSALITPNGAVAALVPVVVVLAMRMNRSPSEMLLPLSFASMAGSLLVLTGSPVNVIVSQAADDAGAGAFNYFEFAIVGLPLLLGTIVITLGLGPLLLPRRHPRSMPPDFSEHARVLYSQYMLDEPLFRLRVGASSQFVGESRETLDATPYGGVEIIDAQEAGGEGPVTRSTLSAGDFLVVRGPAEVVERMASENDLDLQPVSGPGAGETRLYSRESGAAEVVIPPRSEAIGEKVFPGMITESGDLVVLAVQRGGEDLPGTTTLEAGDTLLLHGPWEALDQNLQDPSVMVVDRPDAVRRQIVPLGPRAGIAISALAGMVVLLAFGIVPPAIAALLAASAIILLGVLTIQQAYRAISWTVVILIGAMIPLSTAMIQTGAADKIAEQLVNVAGDGSPYLLIFALFVLVATLGQLISNTATALIITPVAIAAAVELDISILPVLMAVNVAAHASFLTPIATTPNLMVMEPGGYQFGDYWKFGSALMVLYLIVAVGLVPLVWHF